MSSLTLNTRVPVRTVSGLTLLPRMLTLEIRLLLTQPLTWLVFIALWVSMGIAAYKGIEFVAQNHAAAAQALAEQQSSVATAKAAHATYTQPSDLAIPMWRDATSAYGFLTQFLVAHAEKPPTPLTGIAVGVADIQPSLVRLSFSFSSVFDDVFYDIGSARATRLGAFDLAFVLIYLTPLGLIALAGTRLSGEQDSGILRLIAAQPISPRLVATAKFAAIAIVSTIAIVGGAALALTAIDAVKLSAEWAVVSMWLSFALTLYIVFWIALCAFAASLWRGAVTALALLVVAWTLITVVLPATATLILEAINPAPSRIAYIDQSRQAQTAFYDLGGNTRIPGEWLVRRYPALASRRDELSTTSEVVRYARDDFFRTSLQARREAFAHHAIAMAQSAEHLSLLSPVLVLDNAFQTAAGTDAHRHATFMQAVGEHGQAIWKFFEPRVIAQAANPRAICNGCQARLDFTAYDDIPAFTASTDAKRSLRAARNGCVYLAALCAFVLVATGWHLRQWPS